MFHFNNFKYFRGGSREGNWNDSPSKKKIFFSLPIWFTILAQCANVYLKRLVKNMIFPKKVRKSAILAQKCKITDFGQISHNNAILLKYCDLVWFLPKNVGSHPHTFPDALNVIAVCDTYRFQFFYCTVFLLWIMNSWW